MISGCKPGSGTARVHCVYDAWNRLLTVRADDSGEPGELLATYEYDGTNRRVEKVVTEAGGGPSVAHYYYNAKWQLLEERFVDGEDATVASNQYAWSAPYIDAPAMRFHNGNGDADYLDAVDNIRYYTRDANYNVTATIDAATGEAVDRYVYTAYGRATVYDENWANPTTPATDGPLYCGYFFDAETGLYQVRNRYYDSGLSVFISRDPMAYAGSANLLSYQNNRPTSATDPCGEQASDPVAVARQACCKWRDLEENMDQTWQTLLPKCPCTLLFNAKGKPILRGPPAQGWTWGYLEEADQTYHKGAAWCMRSDKSPPGAAGGQQCCFDSKGALITHGEGAGTPDKHPPGGGLIGGPFVIGHVAEDVKAYDDCRLAGMLTAY